MAISQRTRKILWTRAADRCAICRCALTRDPRHSDDRAAVLGMECHIVARSKGGPRSGEVKQSDSDAYPNLILLCPTHHKEVDDQTSEYTIERLREIKRRHEEWVHETLEWRAAVPDFFWERVKQEAEELLLSRSEEVDGGIGELVESLGIFAQVTAELLISDELVLFLRGPGKGVALAFKYDEGSVSFDHAAFDGFAAGFSTFEDAATIEDRTSDIVLRREAGSPQEDDHPMQIFDLAGEGLLAVAEKVSSEAAVFYVRDAPPSDLPQFGFRVEDGDVLVGAGPPGSFDDAFDEFVAGNPVDVSDLVRVRMFANYCQLAMEGDDPLGFEKFLANHFTISALSAFDRSECATEVGRRGKDRFAELLRNRFYEALLMLRAAHRRPEDPAVCAWMETNLDRRPPDGLTAALPIAAEQAVEEFVERMELGGFLADELEADVFDAVYGAIPLVLRFEKADVEAQEGLARLILENVEWWRLPEASPEIAALAAADEDA